MSSILIVDDERDIRELIGDILQDEGFQVRLAANADECMAEINAEQPALMILDIWLKDSRMDGIDILKTVKRDNPDVPVVIISGHGNIEIAVAAIKQGAYDFIEKPFNIDQLMVVVSRAMETSRLRRENSELRRKDVTSSEMLGSSPAFRGLKLQLEKVTKSNGRVMLTGPAGSGKELAARHIHAHSARASAPFISVSSAAIEPERMEEVLFGRETPERGWSPVCWNRRMAAWSISMKWPTCRWARNRKSCAFWWNSSSSVWAGRTRCASICGSSAPPPAICEPRSRRAVSGRSCTTG